MRYVLHPGEVTSINDGDQHYISYEGLLRCYNLHPRFCVNVNSNDYEPWSGDIHLYPEYSGNYKHIIDKLTIDKLKTRNDDWKKAIDEALLGIDSTADSFAIPQEAIRALIDWHVSVALDPTVNGGKRLISEAVLKKVMKLVLED